MPAFISCNKIFNKFLSRAALLKRDFNADGDVPCQYYKIFKSSFFNRTSPVAASEVIDQIIKFLPGHYIYTWNLLTESMHLKIEIWK